MTAVTVKPFLRRLLVTAVPAYFLVSYQQIFMIPTNMTHSYQPYSGTAGRGAAPCCLSDNLFVEDMLHHLVEGRHGGQLLGAAQLVLGLL